MQHYLATPMTDSVDLDLRRGDRHDDGGSDAELLRREGNALGMIAGRGTDDALVARRRREACDAVIGAADLERKDRLQVLALQQDLAVKARAEARHRVKGALDRHVIDTGIEDAADIIGHGTASFLGLNRLRIESSRGLG